MTLLTGEADDATVDGRHDERAAGSVRDGCAAGRPVRQRCRRACAPSWSTTA